MRITSPAVVARRLHHCVCEIDTLPASLARGSGVALCLPKEASGNLRASALFGGSLLFLAHAVASMPDYQKCDHKSVRPILLGLLPAQLLIYARYPHTKSHVMHCFFDRFSTPYKQVIHMDRLAIGYRSCNMFSTARPDPEW